MNGADVFKNFKRTFKVTERHKAKISGNFKDLDIGNVITIQLHAASNVIDISYIDNVGHTHEFSGYTGQIRNSLLNFDLEDYNG